MRRARRGISHRGLAYLTAVGVSLILLVALNPSPAQADFGLHGFDVTFEDADGTAAAQAGSHPFSFTTSFAANLDGEGEPEGWLRDIFLEQVTGFVADTTAYPRCTSAQFLQVKDQQSACPLQTAVGVTAISASGEGSWYLAPVFNLTPPPGVLVRLGFTVFQANIVIDAGLSQTPPYNATAASRSTSQILEFFAAKTQLWGEPSDPRHDGLRGPCGFDEAIALPSSDPAEFVFEGSGECPVEDNPKPFLSMPTSCAEPLLSSYWAISWEGASDAGQVLSHDAGGNPVPFAGCGSLPSFDPQISAQPTSRAAQSPTGLDFALQIADEGLTSVGGRSKSRIRAVEVTLPDGMSANPSLAEGLEVCSEEDLEDETLQAAPGEGCPQASKIGSLEVESPLVEEAIKGSLYQATPYHNLAEDSLLAFYIVFKNEELGIIVKQPAKVVPDPLSGRLTTITSEIPQLPFSAFRLRFREGARSPLVTPPACGTHTVSALITPWSGGPPVKSSSSFEIVSGADNSPCPSGGLPPFRPGLLAGTTNNAAGRFSPFNLRLHRSDGEQEFTRFSIKLPPGIAAILAGIPKCADAAIEAAKQRTGTAELASPSCPAASLLGRTLAGSGVGPALAYAPGKIYLAGPYEGAPISIAAITAAVVGPFDLGTVVIRQGFKIDPRTAEVFLDPIGSDPIPHIIDGIVVHARDIRAYVDRPSFVFNPTSCERTSTASTVLGSGLDFASAADDNPVVVSTPFQAADCAALPFKPKLRFRLKGGTKRGAHPSLRAHLQAGGLGAANIARARVTLPRSEFLENAHIGTVCTRVQYAADQCPAASVYGYATATTPILDQPLTGPIYLRSSEHQLPDLVAAFRSAEGIKFDLLGRVDSVKGGGIRNSFEIVPDAPVTSADFTFFGAKKGLLVNSTNLCRGRHLVKVELTAHSGKRLQYATPLKPTGCKKKHKRKRGAVR